MAFAHCVRSAKGRRAHLRELVSDRVGSSRLRTNQTELPCVVRFDFCSGLEPEARRVKQTVLWTVCSQSGEQFIIATCQARALRKRFGESFLASGRAIYDCEVGGLRSNTRPVLRTNRRKTAVERSFFLCASFYCYERRYGRR